MYVYIISWQGQIFCFLHNSQRLNFPTLSCIFLYSFEPIYCIHLLMMWCIFLIPGYLCFTSLTSWTQVKRSLLNTHLVQLLYAMLLHIISRNTYDYVTAIGTAQNFPINPLEIRKHSCQLLVIDSLVKGNRFYLSFVFLLATMNSLASIFSPVNWYSNFGI